MHASNMTHVQRWGTLRALVQVADIKATRGINHSWENIVGEIVLLLHPAGRTPEDLARRREAIRRLFGTIQTTPDARFIIFLDKFGNFLRIPPNARV